jgi:DNA invertase Pin-like site-specific DNA recombinase
MIAIYVRQSVDKKDSISIDTQIRFCRREINDDSVFKVYEDRGYSGKNIKRPAFTELMQAVGSGMVSKIIVYRLDRFSRSVADFGAVWQVLEKHKVEFVSVNERFDTSTPIGVAMLNIIMVFAQLERQTIAERVRDNYYARAVNGSWVGGPAPYGYRVEKINLAGKLISRLTYTNDIEVVKRIYEEYADEDVSLGDIARKLTSENIPCISRKGWDSVAVSRILRNPIYARCDLQVYLYFEKRGISISNAVTEFYGKRAGMLVGKRNRSKGKYNADNEQRLSLALHNGVISAELWLKCREKAERNSQIKNSGSGKHSYLTGLIKCGSCGYGIRIIKNNGSRYLVCSGKTNYHLCNKSYAGFDLSELETEVLEEMKRMFKNQRIEINDDCRDNLSEKNELAEIDKKIERLAAAVGEGTAVGMKYINREMERLEHQRKGLLYRLSDKKNGLGKIYTFDGDSLETDEKRQLAGEFIEKIEIEGDEVRVIWKE